MFPIPNLPTDNLYKFKFLGGISILLFAAYIYSTQLINSYSKLTESKIEVKKLEFRKDLITDNIKETKKEISELRKKFEFVNLDKKNNEVDFETFKTNILNDKNYREYLVFTSTYQYLLPGGSSFKKIDKLTSDAEQLLKEFEKNSINIEALFFQSEYESKKLGFVSIMFLILCYFGLKYIKIGYNEWFEFVQKPSDEKLKLEIEKLRIENQRDLNKNDEDTKGLN